MAARSTGGAEFPQVDRRRWGDTDVHWRWVLAGFNAYWSLGYLLGPDAWTTSGSFSVINGWGLSFRVYGALLLALAVGVACRRTVHGAAGALAVFWAIWGMALLCSTFTGTAQSWGGPAFAWLACAVHGFQMTRPHAPRAVDRRVQN